MKKIDIKFIQEVERQVKEKFGKEALKDPNELLSDKFKADFEVQLRERAEKERKKTEEPEIIEQDGFFIAKKLITKDRIERTCPMCKTFSFDIRDDVHMLKHGCCLNCFILHIEGKEKNGKNENGS